MMSSRSSAALFAAVEAGDWTQLQALLEPSAIEAFAPAERSGLRELLLMEGRAPLALRLGRALPAEERIRAEHWIHAALDAHLRDDFETAAACARRACELDRGEPAAQHHLGRALHNLGQTRDALRAFEHAVTLQRTFAPGWFSLAVAQRAGGRAQAAVASFRRAAEYRPSSRAVALNLGKTLLSLGQSEAARAVFAARLERDPGDVDARVHLGLCEHQLGDTAAAAACYEQAIARDPQHALGWLYFGTLLNQLHASARAEHALLQATRLAPEDPEGWAELTSFYEVESRLPEMQQALQRGLAIAPQDPRLQLEQAILARRQGEFVVALDGLRAIAVDQLAPRHALRHQFELGQLLDRIGDADGAFDAFQRANAQSRSLAPGLADEAAALRERYAQIVDWMQRPTTTLPGASDQPQPAPIFLLGFPRSGTTLLRTMLGAHPDLQTLEERPTLEACISLLDQQAPGYPWALDRLSAQRLQELRAAYARAVVEHGGGERLDRLVDTHPYRSPHLGLIRHLFPRAPVIFLQRHPCDVILSCFMQPFAANAGNWHFQTLEDSVDYYLRFIACWQASVERCDAAPPLLYRYEDLVEAPEARLRELLNTLRIDWHPDVLRHHELHQRGGRVTTSSYQQVSRPVYRDALGRWQRYRRHFAPYLDRLRPIAERYGYSLDPD